MNQVEIEGWMRISKSMARKLYDAGQTIRVCPCKVNPCNEYYPLSFDMNKEDDVYSEPTMFDWEIKFDTRVNRFEYYNCQYNETGKYSAFYVKKEVLA